MTTKPEMWKQALAEHTGQWAFMLSISRRMVFFLRLIRDGEYWEDRGGPVVIGDPRRHFITTCGSLEARGLIERHMRPSHVFKGIQQFGLDWKLTPAGECVCQLLEYAGLMAAAKPKRAAK